MGKLYPFCIFGGDANIEKSKYGDVQKWLPIKDIKNNCEGNHSIRPDDEIEALASLIKARATIKSTKSYL